MFYIVDLTTGEVLGETANYSAVDTLLDDLTATYPLESLFVQGGCESGYGLSAADWLGAVS